MKIIDFLLYKRYYYWFLIDVQGIITRSNIFRASTDKSKTSSNRKFKFDSDQRFSVVDQRISGIRYPNSGTTIRAPAAVVEPK